ncbi:LutC/YkgG family protein [Virgibacillus sp. W0430]|uniref:LutC/YkgG family protein n=1 Tax=Virgibacillus sp. W0430 TaxID=3391580 RepID=UPI003F4507F3
MTIHNRDVFLENVAANLGRQRRTHVRRKTSVDTYPQWNVYEDYTVDELVDVLEKQCTSIHTDFKKTTSLELPNVLEKVIKSYKGESLIVSDDKRNQSYNLINVFTKLKSEGTEVHIWDPALQLENQHFAERADIGITFSDITLAESGTVTIFNDKYNGRSISLLPKNYITIIPKDTLVPRLSQATRRIHEMEKKGDLLPSCISFITGPSNSADIEMNLIVGVHGPVSVTYIVVS